MSPADKGSAAARRRLHCRDLSRPGGGRRRRQVKTAWGTSTVVGFNPYQGAAKGAASQGRKLMQGPGNFTPPLYAAGDPKQVSSHRQQAAYPNPHPTPSRYPRAPPPAAAMPLTPRLTQAWQPACHAPPHLARPQPPSSSPAGACVQYIYPAPEGWAAPDRNQVATKPKGGAAGSFNHLTGSHCIPLAPTTCPRAWPCIARRPHPI